jgi:anti-anti-sigma regulatory factor
MPFLPSGSPTPLLSKGTPVPLRIADSPTDRQPGDHVCWPYSGRDEFVRMAVPYICEGVERGEAVVVVTAESDEDMMRAFAGVPELERLVSDGQVMLSDYNAFLDGDLTLPDRELSMLEALYDNAVAAGFPAVRLLSDATARSMEQEWRAWHVATEHVLDRFCLKHPVTAICAYDVSVLDPESVTEMASVHSITRPEWAAFQLRAATKADMELAGSVDAFSSDELELALDRVRRSDTKGMIVIDATDADFLDHRALMAIDSHALRTHTTAVLWSPPKIAQKITEELGLKAVRVVIRD